MAPPSFLVPDDFALLREEQRRAPAPAWIVKPLDGRQGAGISLCRGSRLGTLREAPPGHRLLVQKYVGAPLTVCGRKFDLRLYLLITALAPVPSAWLCREGFARFSAEQYAEPFAAEGGGEEGADWRVVHLTNHAVQCEGPGGAPDGGWDLRWSLLSLRRHLQRTYGEAATTALFADIEQRLVPAVVAAARRILVPDARCFELFGVDVMVDEALKPWLLEVNASPSLSSDAPDDLAMKARVVNGVLDALELGDGLADAPDTVAGFVRVPASCASGPAQAREPLLGTSPRYRRPAQSVPPC